MGLSKEDLKKIYESMSQQRIPSFEDGSYILRRGTDDGWEDVRIYRNGTIG